MPISEISQSQASPLSLQNPGLASRQKAAHIHMAHNLSPFVQIPVTTTKTWVTITIPQWQAMGTIIL